MATDNIKTKKGSSPVSYDVKRGGEIQTDTGPYIGIIKHNEDPLRLGRVMVYVRDICDSDENDSSQWILMSYMSPFFGYTPHDLQTTKDSSFTNNTHSYGMWFPPPDVGVQVMCMFAKGDFQTQGYYIGCIPQPQINHMVPAYGSKKISSVTFNNSTETAAYTQSGATQLPIVELSKSKAEMNNDDFYKTAKPVNSVIAAQLDYQGLISDTVRGPITTSSQRETPSYSYGISTPGRPIMESGLHEDTMRNAIESNAITDSDLNVEGRRSGHSFVMDDGDVDGNDVLMRLRTSSGHQLSMSDDGQCIYITHANGKTWLEFGNEGTVDVYSTNSINLRSQGDVNIHADQDINMHAKRNVNIYSNANTKIEAEKVLTGIGKERADIYSASVLNLKSNGELVINSTSKLSLFAQNDDIDMKGSNIQLNTNSGKEAQVPSGIQKQSLPDTIKDGAGWHSQDGILNSIVTRSPTHEPYLGHNAAIPIAVPQVLGSAVGAPPIQPSSSAVSRVSANAASAPQNPVKPSDIVKKAQSNPSAKAIGNLTKEDTTGIQAQLDTALKDFGNGAEQLTGIPNELMCKMGIIKPGIDFLNKSPADQIKMLGDPSIFTGAFGVSSLASLGNDILKTDILNKAMDINLTDMVGSGLMNGAEKAVDMAAMVGASLTGATTSQLSDFASGAMSSVSNILGNKMGKLAQAAQFGSKIVNRGIDLLSNGLPDINVGDLGTKALGQIKSMVGGVLNGGPIKKLGEISVSAINQTGIIDGANRLINNVKIPSFDNFSNKVVSGIKDKIPSVSDMTTSASNVVGGITSGASSVYNKIRNFF